jgi:cytidylate kinase
LEEVKQNIAERDLKDSKRQADPLKKADDAIEIDTTNLSFEQQVEKICLEISEVLKETE